MAVISVTTTIPVTGARTVAPKNAAIPTSAIGTANCDASSGHTALKHPTNRSPHSAPTAKQRREQSARHRRRVRQGACDEPHRKYSDDDGQHEVLSAEDPLCQVLAAAHRERVDEHREPDDRTDDGRLRQGRDAAYRSDVVKEPQHQPVVNGTETSGQQAEGDEKGQPCESRSVDGFDLKVGMVSQHQP